MARRRLQSALSVLGAAALLVAGADLASYAATGRGLVLGRANVVTGPTTIQNTGSGPALTLRTRRSAPPLSVTSSRLVKRLNVARVGGRTARELDPTLVTYRIGRAGAALSAGEHFISVPAPRGSYRVAVTGLWESGTPGDHIQCIVVDPRVYADGDLAQVYAEVNAVEGETNGQALDQVQYVTFPRTPRLTLGCDTSGDTGPIHLGQPVTFTFAKVRPRGRSGVPAGVPRSFLSRLSH